jgi:hypothetical protein
MVQVIHNLTEFLTKMVLTVLLNLIQLLVYKDKELVKDAENAGVFGDKSLTKLLYHFLFSLPKIHTDLNQNKAVGVHAERVALKEVADIIKQ